MSNIVYQDPSGLEESIPRAYESESDCESIDLSDVEVYLENLSTGEEYFSSTREVYNLYRNNGLLTLLDKPETETAQEYLEKVSENQKMRLAIDEKKYEAYSEIITLLKTPGVTSLESVCLATGEEELFLLDKRWFCYHFIGSEMWDGSITWFPQKLLKSKSFCQVIRDSPRWKGDETRLIDL